MSSPDPSSVVARLTGRPPRAVRGDRVELADGRHAVLKTAPGQPGQTAAEVAGLRWLADAGQVPVPAVLGHDADTLLVEYLPPSAPDRAAATGFGRALARLHAAGAPAFGSAPPGGPERAWIGRAPMADVTGEHWPAWYAEHRVLSYLRLARDGGGLTGQQARLVEAACEVLNAVAGPPVRPARLHGDLWSGNVCWSTGPPDTESGGPGGAVAAWLIDPAAHGGHPETDLAMLALFGCPYLDAVREGYQQITPLAAGWPERVGMHQLFPLMVHVVLFGGGYTAQAVQAARSTLALAQRLP